ncbi:MAG: hypothetical protein ACOX3V_07910 [Bacillota bacterium]
MAEASRIVPVSEYESVLKRVRDVITARVVAAADGSIEEVHILAGAGRAVKYIVRDVESSIIAAFGVPLDRRKISVAQIGQSAASRDSKRVQLVKVEIISEADGAQVVVHLKWAGKEVSGCERGTPTPRNWLVLAASATMKALSEYVMPEVSFHLQDVTVAQVKSLRVALVSIIASFSGREQLLTGSCPVSLDEREAAVKATLDALNRRFSVFADQDG